MGLLVQELPLAYELDDLVVPEGVRLELELITAWVQQLPKVRDSWGFAPRIPGARALRALFSGPSGTGKTMAAQAVAKTVGRTLYRIDLPGFVAQNGSETQQKLSRLFSVAEEANAILLFDDAEVLLGREVRIPGAGERAADPAMELLLKRMASHAGLAILVVNTSGAPEETFVRRFDFSVAFPMPAEASRLRIWKTVFPPEAEIAPDVEFVTLARRYEMTGGEIHDAVVAAAMLAASEGTPISMAHLHRGIEHALRRAKRHDQLDPISPFQW